MSENFKATIYRVTKLDLLIHLSPVIALLLIYFFVFVYKKKIFAKIGPPYWRRLKFRQAAVYQKQFVFQAGVLLNCAFKSQKNYNNNNSSRKENNYILEQTHLRLPFKF